MVVPCLYGPKGLFFTSHSLVKHYRAICHQIKVRGVALFLYKMNQVKVSFILYESWLFLCAMMLKTIFTGMVYFKMILVGTIRNLLVILKKMPNSFMQWTWVTFFCLKIIRYVDISLHILYFDVCFNLSLFLTIHYRIHYSADMVT